MAKKFKTGDVVKLKSGGPDMTFSEYCSTFIGDIPFGSAVRCTWYEPHSRDVKQHYFHEDMLEISDSKDSDFIITGMEIT